MMSINRVNVKIAKALLDNFDETQFDLEISQPTGLYNSKIVVTPKRIFDFTEDAFEVANSIMYHVLTPLKLIPVGVDFREVDSQISVEFKLPK